jgi:integrase
MSADSKVDRRVGVKAGPHVERKLTAAFVKKAPPGRYCDGGGLMLHVDRTGARRWFLRVVAHGARKDYGIGPVSFVSLTEARETAGKMRKIARMGGDPLIVRHEQESAAMTFRKAAKEVHDFRIRDTSRSGKHVDQWWNTLEHYVFPAFGELSVSEITGKMVVDVLKPIWRAKPETARRVLQRIDIVLQWSEVQGWRDQALPLKGIRKTLGNQGDRVKHFEAISHFDVADLMAALAKVPGVGSAALRFTILTASRSGPVRQARWDEFSNWDNTWTVPAEHMKGGREFVVPLCAEARDIILAQREVAGDAELVFPSPRDGAKQISENTMAKILKKFHPSATVHGMRSTFRDWCEEFTENVPREVKEAALAHASGNKVDVAYRRTIYLDHRENLMGVWGLYATGAGGTYEDLVRRAMSLKYLEIDAAE